MSWLADALLVLHALVVVFIVGGLPFIWIGAWRNWNVIRNPWFRIIHLGAILVVAMESILGLVCPLTAWEDALRFRDTNTGWIERWLHSLLFHDLPGWIFLTAYLLFALAVTVSFFLIPPRLRRR